VITGVEVFLFMLTVAQVVLLKFILNENGLTGFQISTGLPLQLGCIGVELKAFLTISQYSAQSAPVSAAKKEMFPSLADEDKITS
jgi:hypothetical protein